ncbi:RagB/SusD family nutrient uptake outer membrane protein [Puteibacter caeruleilacunae]|nr:RagB/SusD family nutrient uptake outer membrane protein [Puteibacter caeruleilacunae]
MKKYNSRYRKTSIGCLLLMLLSFSACDYLDFDESNRLYDEESVFTDFGYTTNILNNLYSYIDQDLGVMGGGAMRACATDDAEFADPNNAVQDMNNGSWSALNVKDDVFEKMYKGIRAANNFLDKFDENAYLEYKYNTSYPKWEDAFKYYRYEARALRAYMYFQLVKRYGDVPLITELLTIEEANAMGKTSYDDVVDFIVSECDAVANELPVSYLDTRNKQTGRVTKGFVYALRSRVLLYAASPLHNSGDSKKWEAAASAALVLIDSTRTKGWYEKELGANGVNNFRSKEVILFKNNTNSSSFEKYNFPVRFTAGSTSHTGVCPTQNLVDAFETKNGYRVTLTSNGWQCDDPEFSSQDPYANRDPRFYQTILYNGATFKGQTIETFVGGDDYGVVTEGGTATGYFLKKYIKEEVNFTPGSLVSKPHFWIVFRYGEILLNYAEAMMGAFNNPDYTSAAYPISAREALNEVRSAADMPLVDETNPEEFMTRLRNERRVELAFEDHRFWDVRRWKLGANTQREIDGVRIVDNAGVLDYSRVNYESRVWNEKMNLYPIKEQELYRNNNLEPQNTGW